MPFFGWGLTLELGSWSLTPYCRGTGVRITMETAHGDSPTYVSKMDSGAVQAMSARDSYMWILDNISRWPLTLTHTHCFHWCVDIITDSGVLYFSIHSAGCVGARWTLSVDNGSQQHRDCRSEHCPLAGTPITVIKSAAKGPCGQHKGEGSIE